MPRLSIICTVSGALACCLVVLKGNLLVLAPVLGVWLYTLLAPFGGAPHCTETRAARRRNKAAPTRRGLNVGLLIMAVVLWSLCGLIMWRRMGNTPAVPPDDAAIAEQMTHAEQLVRVGRFADALAAFESIAVPRTAPRRCAQKYHNIGVLSMRLERWAEAEQAFRNAVTYDAADLAAHFNLGRLSFMQRDIKEARRHLTQALKIDPNHPGARDLLARCHVHAAELGQAFAELESADAATPADQPLKPATRTLKERIRRRVPVSH